jgi:hypothetical protein
MPECAACTNFWYQCIHLRLVYAVPLCSSGVFDVQMIFYRQRHGGASARLSGKIVRVNEQLFYAFYASVVHGRIRHCSIILRGPSLLAVLRSNI